MLLLHSSTYHYRPLTPGDNTGLNTESNVPSFSSNYCYFFSLLFSSLLFSSLLFSSLWIPAVAEGEKLL